MDGDEDERLLRTSRRNKSIRKVREWQEKDCDNNNNDNDVIPTAAVKTKPRPLFRGRTPSFEALKCAVTELYRIDDFDAERIGEGFFSEVFKVTHRVTDKVMVLKKNKYRSNSLNSLKEIQLMNKLKHPNILKFEAVCVHEGQLHALTEFIEGGTLEEMIADPGVDLSWTQRVLIGVDIVQGLQYLNSREMFHRDLTSKNIFMKGMSAIIGDFGLATRIPKATDPRLPQVGSPYWMSPECLRGEFYDQAADIFSFGIIMCELIARVSADPDFLPRTQNFGVEYKAFSALCPACPPDFLKTTFSCVSIDPGSRPTPDTLLRSLRQVSEKLEKERESANIRRFVAKMSDSSNCDVTSKKTPSEKARLHSKSSISTATAIGEEMCRLDPHYEPQSSHQNPFQQLPQMREGRKIIGTNSELFSSCAELPSPQNNYEWFRRKSLPYHCKQYSPPHIDTGHKRIEEEASSVKSAASDETIETSTAIPSIQFRVQKLLSATQDDSSLQNGHSTSPGLRKWGSFESGIFSASTEENNLMSNRSLGSSLLTVSDLEEDLRAASALLYRKETGSIVSDSLEDLSARLDDISNVGMSDYCDATGDKYERDIRDIVEYFERNCQSNHQPNKIRSKTTPESQRSKKIESLIMKVAENKSRARHGQQQFQICDGIVRSKLPLFDQSQARDQVVKRKKALVNNQDSHLDRIVEIVNKKS